MFISTKPDGMLSYFLGLLNQSYNVLITLSYKVMYYTKTIISLLTAYLWPSNYVGW